MNNRTIPISHNHFFTDSPLYSSERYKISRIDNCQKNLLKLRRTIKRTLPHRSDAVEFGESCLCRGLRCSEGGPDRI